jgi:hypothetical protein
MGPPSAAAADSGPVQGVADVAQTMPLGSLLPDSGDDGLLLRVLGEPFGARRG